jgi:carboxylate-amine ligase
MDATSWRAQYENGRDLTLGLEEELLLLHPETLAPLPEGARAIELIGGPPGRFRTELPSAQIEQVTDPCETLDDALEALRAGRREMAEALSGFARLAGSATHPSAPLVTELAAGERYVPIIAEYGPIAQLELVQGLHVHVGVRGADRALAVFNALRGHLPEVAAQAGNGPFLAGHDTGLASVRPKLAELLPRQGTPPVIESYEWLAALTEWGPFPDATHLWWEARLHPRHPTIEVRCADQQITAEDSAAVADYVFGLVRRLCARYDAGEALPAHDAVRISENRWRALRHGLDGALLDLETGDAVPTRELILARIEETGASRARALAERNGTERQRDWAAELGIEAVIGRLAGAFLD